MSSIEIHDVKKIKVERHYLEDTKTHVLNMFIDTERFGYFHISFFADEIGDLQIIHKEGE